ncbi:MAG: efflux RND transporter periplasmic adaptor subunit [Lutibacter sp.]|uniref:efflux RND transporter periplasmic adaptor subunit n=1 Tax=Lutibacter sp. TaxID=1925666 RepID=UPI001A024263|nr:efflux RND transporter periplasmic adaptor subunit [Lutibacter sp.]NOR28058.1 efflux RND transporter periplasmic adaptor subunit [Lutibacter sp.]
MKTYIIKSIFLFLVMGVTSCDSSKSTEKETETSETIESSIEITTAQFESSKMELGQVSTQTFTEGIKTNGYIDVPPAYRAKVSAIMGGFIKNAPLLIGDKVNKGQLLLTIENPDFIEIQQNYAEITEQLIYLKSENERQKTLFNEKITSQKNYLKAKSDYKSALALSNGLAQKLKLMNINPVNVRAGKITSTIAIYAPISGSITAVFTNVGEFKNSSEVLLEIINDEHKHLELVVFEKDILNVKEEQPILFSIPESSLNKHNATVHLVGKSINENRTVKVHGHLENENEPFLVGMFVEAKIITNSIQKIALPVSSVLEEDGTFYILVLKDRNENSYQFEKIKITIGAKNEDWIEVLDSNLSEKEILIKGAFLPIE